VIVVIAMLVLLILSEWFLAYDVFFSWCEGKLATCTRMLRRRLREVLLSQLVFLSTTQSAISPL